MEPLGVDDEHRRAVVRREELGVRVAEPLQVGEVDAVLHRHAAAAHAREQRRRRRLQADDEIGLAELRRDRLVHLRVEAIFLVAEVELREKRVLGEHEVADDRLREHARLGDGAELALALEQEEELGLERVARAVVVEAGEERVLARLLEQQLGADPLGEQARKRRLAGADRPLDGDVAETLERPGAGHRERKTK